MTPESDSILARLSAVGPKTPPCRSPPAMIPVNRDRLAPGSKRMDAGRRGFPDTRWSLVLRAAGEPTDASRRALDELFRDYRAPLLAAAGRLLARWGPGSDGDRAEDLVHGFVEAHLVDQSLLRKADPARGRFRTLLNTALHNYWRNDLNARKAWKNGGRARFEDAEAVELPSGALSTDRLYDRAWAQALLDRALARLGASIRPGKDALFEALRDRIALNDDDTTLGDIAASLGMTDNAVKVALFRLRERFYELVRREVADTLERAEDVDAELRDLHAAWKEDV
jgi:DNA-directed RNA polymerase specialized sigma24 family protein